jgi:hypothetical protein
MHQEITAPTLSESFLHSHTHGPSWQGPQVLTLHPSIFSSSSFPPQQPIYTCTLVSETSYYLGSPSVTCVILELGVDITRSQIVSKKQKMKHLSNPISPKKAASHLLGTNRFRQ